MEVWEYLRREKDINSQIKILAEKTIEEKEIAFIEVTNVDIAGEFYVIDFMPFEKLNLKSSLLNKICDIDDIDVTDKINDWLEQNGGVWGVSVSEALDITEQTMINPATDS